MKYNSVRLLAGYSLLYRNFQLVKKLHDFWIQNLLFFISIYGTHFPKSLVSTGNFIQNGHIDQVMVFRLNGMDVALVFNPDTFYDCQCCKIIGIP